LSISPEQFDSAERRLREVIAAYRGPPQSSADHWRTELTVAFYAGDLGSGEQILMEALNDVPPLAVLDEILAPAMHDIGALWERNQVTIADEHVATWVAQRLILTIAPALRVVPTVEREIVLLAAPTPERHTTGLMMADAVLRGAGYQPVFLGAGVPVAALAEAVARHRPAIVAFSTTMAFPLELETALRAVLERDPQVRLLVGGASSALAPPSLPTAQVSGMGELIGAVEQALK
jgi:methanogenic corrinoid protein MtbC1